MAQEMLLPSASRLGTGLAFVAFPAGVRLRLRHSPGRGSTSSAGLLPIGFGIQAVALLVTSALPRWQGLLFLTGVLFVGTPDGVEVVNLPASVLLAVAVIPYGIRLMRHDSRSATA